MARRPRSGPPEEPIELVSLSGTEAEIVASRLRTEGIDAVVFAAGGTADLVAIQFSHGSRVMVRRDQHEAATALLAEWGGPDAGGASIPDAELTAQAVASDDTDFDDGARI